MLSTPPAFILSQDQTLMFKCLILAPVKTGLSGTSLWSAENEVLMCKSPICAVYFLLKVFVLWTILSFHFWNCFLNRIFRVALLFIYQGTWYLHTKRRRWDLNPCAAVNDLLPFQGSPFGQLGYFSKCPRSVTLFRCNSLHTFVFFIQFSSAFHRWALCIISHFLFVCQALF